MKDYNEQEVILKLQDTSTRRAAFEMVVRHYSRQLYWQIRRIVIDHDDANDLLQNTFIKAWMNVEYFRGDAKISTWLYRIAVNECMTFMSRKSQTMPLDQLAEAKADELAADHYFSGDEAQLLLQKAIMTLPDKQRMVFNLRYFDEMPYEEMSQVFGTSVGALKASYHIAVGKVEAYVKRHSG